MTADGREPVASRQLTRRAAGRPAAAPVRIVHLGLGNFFRAHQAWYTAAAPDAAHWGIAAFTGRSTGLAESLTAQEGLYTLITRAATGDSGQIIGSVSRAHSGPDTAALIGYLIDPAVAVITLTVTEAGYARGSDGLLDRSDPDVVADLAVLREVTDRHGAVPPLRTTPARLVAALRARRVAEAGPIAIVPCDNLPENGRVVAAVVLDFATDLDPSLAGWIRRNVSFVTTMVDRITPATTAGDVAAAERLTGLVDVAPVVTEPFREWVLSGEFPAGRPAWEAAGATFVPDIAPFEERKLWLLNGGHSLLAYLGSPRGHATIADAMADPFCRSTLLAWWGEAAPFLTLPTADVAAYQASLIDRFTNPAIAHRLAQIGTDGSTKLPVRIVPVLRRLRSAGSVPPAAVLMLAGWIEHLRGCGTPVNDVNATRVVELAAGTIEVAAQRVVDFLDPGLGRDEELLAAVVQACGRLGTDNPLRAGTA
jgi:fructuronate reductase